MAETRVFAIFLNRRQLLKLAGVCILAEGALAACGSGASPAASGAAASAANGAAAGARSAGASPAVKATTWDELLAAGKAEGMVVVAGSPDATVRQTLPDAFKQAYGIEMEYLPGATEVTARLQSERQAGLYSLDVEINGSDSIYGTLMPNGWVDPIKPYLLLPDAADGSKWKAGVPWFRDPNEDTALQIFSSMSQNLTLNSDIVKSSDIPAADTLLDPKWKGKICSFDPSVNGGGLSVGSAYYVSKGEDWVTKLFKGQNVTLSRDYKQLADWVAHGSYPIGIGIGANYLTEYMQAGVHFEQPPLPDAPNPVGGGFGIVVVMNRAPHPNAARVFANWIASKDGMTVYSKAQTQAPTRSDIDPTWVPSYLIPKSGVKYLDTYEYNFATKQRLQIRDFYAKMLK